MGSKSREILSLTRVLWPASKKFSVSVGKGKRHHPSIEEFALFPSGKRPRLLVPLGARKAAFACLGEDNNGVKSFVRLARLMAGVGIRSRVLEPLLQYRVKVVATGADHDGAQLVQQYIESALGCSNLRIAVVLGQARMSWKPTLQLLTPSGRIVGFAKIGWDDFTRRLIEHEANTLEKLRRASPRTFTVPEILHFGTWADLSVLVVSPASDKPRWLARRDLRLPLGPAKEIALMFGHERQRLMETPFWSNTLRRLGALAASAHCPTLDTQGLVDDIERLFADTLVLLGAWHGDFNPWNMRWIGERLFVWDWERASSCVPVGFDALHFHFQVFRHGHRDVRSALGRSIIQSQPFMDPIATRRTQNLIAKLYAIELLLRYYEAIEAGRSVNRDILAQLSGVLVGGIRES